MRVAALSVRDFRNYERAEIELAEGLTLLTGPNGSGKTNLLEAVYFGCTGRSPRTSNERELVRRGARVTRVEVTTAGGADGAQHRIDVGFEPGAAKAIKVDGAAVTGTGESPARPLLSVFMPERLELVKGAPATRRAHLDNLVAALWPSRRETRAAYGRALAQRNALLLRIRAGAAGPDALGAWDAEVSRHGAALMADRAEAAELVAPGFAARARDLGLPEEAELRYRPRSRAADAAGLAEELRERRQADLERGFTAHGPHRDEVTLAHAGNALRAYGSQGQQRSALLALLFAERDLLLAERGTAPVMLLDDVMSELDSVRRELLGELLRAGGQSLVTATEPGQLPGAAQGGAAVLEVTAGTVTPARGVPA